MTDTTRDFFATLERVLLRCWILGFGLMLFAMLMLWLMQDFVHGVHGHMFGLSAHELDVIMYCWMGLFKALLLVAFFFPWLSIRLVLRGKPDR